MWLSASYLLFCGFSRKCRLAQTKGGTADDSYFGGNVVRGVTVPSFKEQTHFLLWAIGPGDHGWHPTSKLWHQEQKVPRGLVLPEWTHPLFQDLPKLIFSLTCSGQCHGFFGTLRPLQLDAVHHPNLTASPALPQAGVARRTATAHCPCRGWDKPSPCLQWDIRGA